MNKWLRRAETNKKMLIALGVLVVAAGGYWGWRSYSSGSEVKDVQERFASYYVTCSECGTLPEKIPADKVKEMNADLQNNLLKCPKCGNYSAKWGKKAPAKGKDAGEDKDSDNP